MKKPLLIENWKFTDKYMRGVEVNYMNLTSTWWCFRRIMWIVNLKMIFYSEWNNTKKNVENYKVKGKKTVLSSIKSFQFSIVWKKKFPFFYIPIWILLFVTNQNSFSFSSDVKCVYKKNFYSFTYMIFFYFISIHLYMEC